MSLAGHEGHLLHLSLLVLDEKEHLPARDQDRLFLGAVVLQRELVPLVDVQDLADVIAGLGPDEFVTPGLLDPSDLLFTHKANDYFRSATFATMNESMRCSLRYF